MQPEIKQAVFEFFAQARPGAVLDFPCGTGWLQDALSGPGWQYHGADLYCEPNVPGFRLADLQERFPYADGQFDYVACLEGLEHIENYHHVLREAQRVLKPGGTLLVSTPNPLNIKSRRRYYWSGTFYGFPHLVNMPPEGSHIHVTPVNLSFLMAFAARHGLKFGRLHDVKIRKGMYVHLPRVWAVQIYTWIKTLSKPQEQRDWFRLLASNQVCLCDGMVVSFTKQLKESPTKPHMALATPTRVPRAMPVGEIRV
jgi:SAM-dependent methyltransferase